MLKEAVDGRICTRCKLWKSRHEFYPSNQVKCGMRPACIPCQKAIYTANNRKYYKPRPKRTYDIGLEGTDAAWLAGLFDGEGCIQIVGRTPVRNPSPSLRVNLSLGMTHRDTILRLYSLVKDVGHVIEVDCRRPNHRKQWRWMVSARAAKAVLDAIYPYLVTKKAEADVAYRFYETVWMDPRRFPEITAHRLALRDEIMSIRRPLFADELPADYIQEDTS